MNQPAQAPAAKKPNHPPAPNFDTMKAMDALKKTGFDQLQAEGLVEFVRESQSRLATKEDLKKHRAATKADFEQFRTAAKADFEKFKVEMRAEFEQFKVEMRAEFEQFRSEVRGDMKTLKADLRGDMSAGFKRMYGFILFAVGVFAAAAKWL